MPRNRYRGPPMTLGNMRENGVRSLKVYCWGCHHDAVLAVDKWPDHVTVPSFGLRMVCTQCGIIGADARPNWSERPSFRQRAACYFLTQRRVGPQSMMPSIKKKKEYSVRAMY